MKLSNECLEAGVQVVCDAILEVAKADPEQFRSWFVGGILGNVFGIMPKEIWDEFSKVEPCGRPGCKCHVMGQKLVDALTLLRSDYKVVIGSKKNDARN